MSETARAKTPSNSIQAARRHHKKHGDMDFATCLLSECKLHYPGVKSTRPPLYFVEYTDREQWEELHRIGDEPADPIDFRSYQDARTLREARVVARRLLEQWEFAQPCVRRRIAFVKRHGGMWDYSSEDVSFRRTVERRTS